MRYPVDSVNISQGYRANPGLFGYGSFGHTGIDLKASIGTPVKAPVTGTVISVGTNPSYVGGLYIIVRQDGGEQWECYMGHLSTIEVSKGQHVAEGQEIAKSGNTGNTTGPHVHFQVRHVNAGELVNPQSLINATSAPSAGGTTVDGKITNNDVGLVRIISSEVKGWNFDEVHSGKLDAQEMKAWVGQPIRSFIEGAWKESESFRYKRIEAINYYDNIRPQVEAQLKTVDGLNSQISDLTERVNGKQLELNELIDERTKLAEENKLLNDKLAKCGEVVSTPATDAVVIDSKSALQFFKNIFNKWFK